MSDKDAERKVVNLVREFFSGLANIFRADDEISRKIVDVDSWDGSASNYSSTTAYCDACLINVNSAAGNSDREEWTQSHCALPVRREGDGADDYVRQAIHAAAGGRGITQVKRPDGVSQEDWDSAIRSAANELIAAYEEMDEIAPDAVFELAGREPQRDKHEENEDDMKKKERALTIGQIADQIWNGFEDWDTYLVDIFVNDDGDDESMFAILARGGKLYQTSLSVYDGSVTMGEEMEVEHSFTPANRVARVIQTDDGKTRVVQVVNTAVLNRVAQIDSMELFDNFIKRAQENDEWPKIDVLHYNEIVVGRVVPGGLMRDDYCYIAVYEFDDTPLGRAAAVGFANDPEYWGASIQFTPIESEIVEVADNVRIPVYKDGVNTYITLVPEARAAAWFTDTKRSRSMNSEDYQVLVKLLGEEEAEQFIDRVKNTNRAIADGNLITREADAAEEGAADGDGELPQAETQEGEAQAQEESQPEVTAQVIDVELADEDVANAVARAAVALPEFNELIAPIIREASASATAGFIEQVNGVLDAIEQLRQSVEARLDVLEQEEQEAQSRWLAELPSRTIVKVGTTHRAREAQAEDEEEAPERQLAGVAQSTLSKWK